MAKSKKTQKKKTKAEEKREANRAIVELKSTLASSTSFMISALTLVAGLAWNDVAKAVFERLKPYLSGWGETLGLFLYALLVTAIAVIIIRRLKKIKDAVGGESVK